ncbi:hypothetical protein [Baekduia sp. Peel2402]|uniref:hypothetical protein n=1 Tax=Baekduia sp. Peel2402 TaxID=3458296 RepID=UPI00403E6D0A
MSQNFVDGPVVSFAPRDLRIRYELETDSGSVEWEEMGFPAVDAFVFTAIEAVTSDQVDAYDTVVEVLDSPWLARVLADRRHPRAGLRHFRIFFDEYGAFDVLAEAFDPPPRA